MKVHISLSYIQHVYISKYKINYMEKMQPKWLFVSGNVLKTKGEGRSGKISWIGEYINIGSDRHWGGKIFSSTAKE